MTSSARFRVVEFNHITDQVGWMPGVLGTDPCKLCAQRVELSLISNGPVSKDILLKLAKLFVDRNDGAELTIHGDSAS